MAVRRAKGKKSRAISDQSGFSVPYTSLKTTWEGFRVEPEEWEPKDPQLTPAKNVIDATALFQPRPDNDEEITAFYVGFNYDIFLDRNQRPNVGVSGPGSAGDVYIEFTEDISSGVGGTGAIGTLAFDSSIDEAGVAGTGNTGTVVPTGEVAGVSGDGGAGAVGVEALSLSIDEAGVAGTGAVGAESVEVLGWGQEGWGVAEWGD
jgi:hypothetical protein|tara:strand:+ start:1158 stop:1772 length:615 start_codon:yes stop_codon:yes gene_type:complete